jgi:hypothetical protein
MGKIEDKLFSHEAAAIAGISAFSLLLLIFMGYFGIETFIKFFGTNAEAEIAVPAYSCAEGRFGGPKITVVVGGESYRFNISKEECLSGKFEVGKIIKVKKHSLFNWVIPQNSHPEFIFLPMLLFIGGGAIFVAFSK